MREFLRVVIERFQIPLDLVFSILSAVPALILLAYRRVGSRRLPITTGMLRSIGVFPIRAHYYEPDFRVKRITENPEFSRGVASIDFDVDSQLRFLSSLHFGEELLSMSLDESKPNAHDFSFFDNGLFSEGDADFLYQFLRRNRPTRVIEVGGGFSTKIISHALQKNQQETGLTSSHTCIEPFEMKWLDEMPHVDTHREKIEDADIRWGEALQAGDLLFLDTSHIIRPYGDVLTQIFDVLPKLRPGVFVHIHDIFTPRHYLDQFLVDDVLFWNEQYLVEALLSNSSRYKVIAMLNFLRHSHFSELSKVCPYLTEKNEPSSLYIQVKE